MSRDALVIGSDLTAFVTALRLQKHGFTVRVLEAPVSMNRPPTLPVILHGPTEQTESLLRQIGAASSLTSSQPVSLEFLSASHSTITFRTPFLPAPWHSLFGLAGFAGLSLGSRWTFFNYLEKVWEGRIQLSPDLHLKTAQDWLNTCGQSDQAQRRFWNPLCLFVLGTNLEHTSAWPFIETLKHRFFDTRRHSQIRLFTAEFGSLLLAHLRKYVEGLGVSFLQNGAIRQIHIPGNRVEGIISADGQTHQSDVYVSTLSPFQVTALLPERHLARNAFFHQLTQLEPVSRIILNFQSDQVPSRPRIVLTDSRFHWMTWYRTKRKEKSFLSCIASGDQALESVPDEQLEATAVQEILNVFPIFLDLPSWHLKKINVIRHTQTSIAYSPGTMTFRPSHNTPLANLFLAGHWTVSNGLIQVEADVQSANRCADMIKERWP